MVLTGILLLWMTALVLSIPPDMIVHVVKIMAANAGRNTRISVSNVGNWNSVETSHGFLDQPFLKPRNKPL